MDQLFRTQKLFTEGGSYSCEWLAVLGAFSTGG